MRLGNRNMVTYIIDELKILSKDFLLSLETQDYADNVKKLEKIELYMENYVEQNPDDIEGYMRTAIVVDLWPLRDYEKAIEILKIAAQHDSGNIHVLLMLAYMHDRNLGYLDEGLLLQLKDLEVEDLHLQLMIEQAKAWYYRSADSSTKNNYRQHLEKSIICDPSTVKPYIDLGQYYLAQGEGQRGKDLIKRGLSNIIKVGWRMRELDDISSVNEFFEMSFRGIYVNPDYYAFLLEIVGRYP